MTSESRPGFMRGRLRKRVVIAALVALVLVVGWFVHAPILSAIVQRSLPWVGNYLGCEISAKKVEARLFTAWILRDVELQEAGGTNLKISKVKIAWDGFMQPGGSIRRMIGRLVLDDVRGTVVLALRGKEGGETSDAVEKIGQGKGEKLSRLGWLPRKIELHSGDLKVRAGMWTAQTEGMEIFLNEEKVGKFRAASASIGRKGWSEEFRDLRAVTAWRDGVAYLSNMELMDGVTVDALSLGIAGVPTMTVEMRAFGGYLYGDFSVPRGRELQAAVNAMNLSLAKAGKIAKVEEELGGEISLAKLTFTGVPEHWLDGQISLRVEGANIVRNKSVVKSLTVGMSMAGRRVRVNEFVLQQKTNEVKLRGNVSLPEKQTEWRDVPVEMDVAFDVEDLKALGGLLGGKWSKVSGGLKLNAALKGRLGDGNGWLKLEAWDLRMQKMRAITLQADAVLQGRDLEVSGITAQSGPNFLRGYGRISLENPLAYQGRVEMRVSEVASYLEPIGRFAPDWAREGGVLLFWDGDGTAGAHSGVASLELVKFTGDLNPVPVNAKIAATYSPGNIYVSRFLLDRGPMTLSSSLYFGSKGLSVQDIQLFAGRTRLVLGELFLPLSLQAILVGKPWRETLQSQGEIYATLRSDDLDLGKVVALFGQETALWGRVDAQLDARGQWESLEADMKMTIVGLKTKTEKFSIPESKVDAALHVKDGKAELKGELTPDGGQKITVQATLPLKKEQTDGDWKLFDQQASWNAEVQAVLVRLNDFESKVFGFPLREGDASVSLKIGNTLAEPHISGEMRWKGVDWKLPRGWVSWTGMAGRLIFEERRARFDGAQAKVGGGELRIAGGVDFEDRQKVRTEVTLEGENLLVYKDDNVQVQCAPKISCKGEGGAGIVSGVWNLAGSRLMKNVEAAPQISPAEASVVEFTAPFQVKDTVFDAWKLDMRLMSDTPLALVNGSIDPDLYLQGTLSDPILLGTVKVENAMVGFSSENELLANGFIYFTKASPWQPLMNVTGVGKVGVYSVRFGVFGALNRGVYFASEPELSNEQVAILLRTGVSPAMNSLGSVGIQSLQERTEESEVTTTVAGKILGMFGWNADGVEKDDESRPPVAIPTEWSLR